MKIPIQNLFFLLTYAWDALDQADIKGVDPEACATPQDLFARILISATERLIRVGLHRSYLDRVEEIPGVRGRIDISASINRTSMLRGRLICEYDELDANSTQNRILVSTLAALSRTDGLSPSLAVEARRICRLLNGIEPIHLCESVFSRIQIHRNVRFYKFILDICLLLYRQLLPTQISGRYVFRWFTEERMAVMFERFLRNFYTKEQNYWPEVKMERFNWSAKSIASDQLSLLPMMETDISLLSPSRRLVVEAKYYGNPLRSRFESGKLTFISGHLYQLAAYLSNLERRDGRVCSGLVLYPMSSVELDASYRLLDFDIRIATVDLRLDLFELKSRLLGLINVPAPLDQV